jgi:2-hydroxychromene-2-carboxylate isomerase
MHPLNLGYVFRHHGYTLMEEPAAKLKNRRRDLSRWAGRYNLAFRMPDVFPIKTSRALRGALAMREWGKEMEYIDALFARYWEHNDASVADYPALCEIAMGLGVDGEAFEAKAESKAIKSALIDATNDALESGVFGAPSFLIDGELYWGKDRMEFVDAALAD